MRDEIRKLSEWRLML
ncbi:MAG: hypothetical protein ACLGG7_11965 [Bacteriovoracia bacterium]